MNSWMDSPATRIKNSPEVLSMGAELTGDAKSLVPCRFPSWESSLIFTLSGNGSAAVGSSTTLISHLSSLEARTALNHLSSSSPGVSQQPDCSQSKKP